MTEEEQRGEQKRRRSETCKSNKAESSSEMEKIDKTGNPDKTKQNKKRKDDGVFKKNLEC